MEERPERIADYFVVVGLGDSIAARFEPFSGTGEEVDLAGGEGCGEGAEPVTDIALIHSKLEQVPEGYKVLDTTVGGQSANLNSGSLFASPIYLCYCQGRDKPPIVEIGVHHTSHGHAPSPGHESLLGSVGGHSGNLSRSGRAASYLTVKRGILFGHNNAITGLSIIMPSKGEEPPPGYKLLKSLDLSKGLIGPSLYLCYCTSLIHPTSVPYTPELLTKYPSEDYPDFPLPESIPLFCLPSGVAVEHWETHTPFPLPTFSTFALTNAQGQCMYGAVVSFYEPLMEHRCHSDMRKALKVDNEAPLHVNKCICLLSHWPFFSAFKSFLSSLYRLSVSANIPLPLERYVGNLMNSVPLPTFIRPRVQMQLGNETIIFSLPVQTPLPLSVSTHWCLLSSLEADSCLTLLALTLLEQKLVLHSSRPALLTWVGEALRSILFPFSWQCTYIPVCPLAFSSYMQAPVPFIIGINSQYFDVFEKPSDICVVDLDTGYITVSKEARQLLDSKPLPSRPSRLLRHRLSQLRSKVVGLDTGMDLAVEVAPMDYTVTYKTDLEAVDVEIREAFLHYFATIMGHYRKCLRPLLSAPSERSHDITLLFDQQLFLKHCSSAESAFFTHFFDTQIFTSFIEQRSFAHTENSALAFFDECAEKIRQNGHAQLLDVPAIVSRRSDLPTVVALPPDDTGLPQGITYSYPIFPSQLDHTLFSAQSGCGDRLKPHLSQHRGSAVQSGSPLVARRTAAEKKKDYQLLQEAMKSDILWSKTLLSHVCSLWYVLLPLHLSNHWNKMAVLSQAFELLEDMRKNQALPNDEVCYRIVMEQCVKLGRPALAVKVYHQMIRAGIQPNAVTYGFYNKAVLESHWLNSRIRWRACFIAITACIFLNNLKNKKNCVRSRGDMFGEADFALIGQRSNSISSRKSIEALNVVGVTGGVASMEHREGLKLRLPAASIHRGSVYKMTKAGKGGVANTSFTSVSAELSRSDSLSTDESGLWSNVQLITGGQSPNASRMLGRMMSQINQGNFPSITIEMTSCTLCPSCRNVLYDEHVMSGWSGDEADYKTSCPYCDFNMVASLTISVTTTLPQHETSVTKTPPTSEVQSAIKEEAREKEGADFGSTWPMKREEWSKKQLRRARPARVIKEKTSSKVGGNQDTPVCTKGESSSNTPTSEEFVQNGMNSLRDIDERKLAGEIDHALTTIITPPNTDPLSRRAVGLINETRDEAEESVASTSAKLTSYVSLSPVHQRSKSKGDELEEPDNSHLGNYIAQMRARGHKRSTSAPIRARLQTAPTNGNVGGALSNHLSELKHQESTEDSKNFVTNSESPHTVPYLSPVVLRKEVETLLSLDGPEALEREELLTARPIIYWNLVWYFSRLYLPTYLPLLKMKSFTRTRPELNKHCVHMRVNLMWDKRFTEVREPLYLIWEGKVPRTVKMYSTPELVRRDSESQLQSLVARTQCGDLCPVLCSLLKDRASLNKAHPQEAKRNHQLSSRSIYRETLFLKSVLNNSVNTDLFDREYRQALQRVPRDLSPLLEPKDHPPSGRALHCRRNFGPLQVI